MIHCPIPISGCESIQGRRDGMEDAHSNYDDLSSAPGCSALAMSLPSSASSASSASASSASSASSTVPNAAQPPVRRALYAVYDGHGGIQVANIAAEKVHTILVQEKDFLAGNIEAALVEAYTKSDQLIVQEALAKKYQSGATAITVVIINDKLYVANLGDAEAILGKKTKEGVEGVCISERHKPTYPTEMERIKNAGGHVILGRVMGTLAVSRALGDAEFKFPQNGEKDHFVSPIPFVQQV
eukprot:TRINITY_DN478_c0_g1_i3.p1 TRINITY_DN478_c0_g1~~TRINITY_DN478_c0_g1_i3.p1  ORF type:complete len:267 (+),score=77.55 TRINITY_DN478_c0_g1_i3:78-803(+)